MAKRRIIARTGVARQFVRRPTGGGGGSVRSALVLGSVHMARFGLGAGTVQAVLRYACMDPYVQLELHMIDRGLWVWLAVLCVGGARVTVETAAAHPQICAHGRRKNSCKECQLQGHARTIRVRGCRERADVGQLADADRTRDGEVPRSSERRLDEVLITV